MKRNKAFTLIELVSVLVILAILALIATPLVLNIIRKARTAADKRSIDAYGRSIELAVADYLIDRGSFPTTIDQLTIKYSGDTVVCITTQLNPDSTVYLSECTVGNRAVEGYTYGTDKSPIYDAYEVGDEVTYNGVDYYVIKNSGIKESSVTLLKAEPLTVEEVNTYGGVGTANNHVNMYVDTRYSSSGYQTASNINGYGGMAYYSSVTCGYVNNSFVRTGCTNSYDSSDIKYVVDAWASTKVPSGLEEARLLTYNDLTENLGYEIKNEGTIYPSSNGETPSWIGIGTYYTISAYNDSNIDLWLIAGYGQMVSSHLDQGDDRLYGQYVVRPVIVLSKSALSN